MSGSPQAPPAWRLSGFGSRRLALVPQRQCEGEPGALAGRGIARDVAAQEAGEAPRDVEAEAGAAGLAGIDPLEALEDPLLILFGDAPALVGDDERGEVPFPLGPEPDLAALGRVAHGVGDEVHHHLERAGESAGRGQALAEAGAVDGDSRVSGADAEQ